MGRARKTPQDQALLKAIALFWREGYEGVGTRMIEEETSITRFTLQTVYGGKRALFLTALDLYLDLLLGSIDAALADQSLQSLIAWLEDLPVPAGLKGALNPGCFMVNSMGGFPAEEADIAARATRFFTHLKGHFQTILQKARDAGTLRVDIDLEDATMILLSCATTRALANKSGGPVFPMSALNQAAANLVASWRS